MQTPRLQAGSAAEPALAVLSPKPGLRGARGTAEGSWPARDHSGSAAPAGGARPSRPAPPRPPRLACGSPHSPGSRLISMSKWHCGRSWAPIASAAAGRRRELRTERRALRAGRRLGRGPAPPGRQGRGRQEATRLPAHPSRVHLRSRQAPHLAAQLRRTPYRRRRSSTSPTERHLLPVKASGRAPRQSSRDWRLDASLARVHLGERAAPVWQPPSNPECADVCELSTSARAASRGFRLQGQWMNAK